MRTNGLQSEFIPCWSVVLRLWVSSGRLELQSLLPVLGCGWGLVYFWKRRQSWDWMKDGSLLILVSILAAPYCWVFDQSVAIPALLHGAYLVRSRVLLAVLALASLVMEIGLVSGINLPSPFYLWTAPMWLAWYLFTATSIRGAGTEAHRPADVSK
jgi:hypothetical protein